MDSHGLLATFEVWEWVIRHSSMGPIETMDSRAKGSREETLDSSSESSAAEFLEPFAILYASVSQEIRYLEWQLL